MIKSLDFNGDDCVAEDDTAAQWVDREEAPAFPACAPQSETWRLARDAGLSVCVSASAGGKDKGVPFQRR